ENARLLGFADRARVMPTTAARALSALQGEGARFNLIFADPPYGVRAVAETVGGVDAARLLCRQGILCIEHDKRELAPERQGSLEMVDQRRFGDTVVSMYRAP